MDLRNTTLALAVVATLGAVACSSSDSEAVVEAPVVEQVAPVAPTPPPVVQEPEPAPERAVEPVAAPYVDPADYLSEDEQRYRNSSGNTNWSRVPADEVDGNF